MDILGGKGICMGPNNFLAIAYSTLPIGITVEGANILTRSLIIFGQGAIRCHPYVLQEIAATRETDRDRAVAAFDSALWGHIKFFLSNMARSFVFGMTGSHFVETPTLVAPETKRYYQQLTRFSSAFAFLSDVSMLVLGGGLKRREKLSARLGDILSLLYLCSATLKRYEDDGRQAADAPLMHWAIWDAMFKAQNAFEGVIANYPSKAVAWFLRRIIFPLGRPYVVPSDRLGHEVAALLIAPSATRDRLTRDMFIALDPNDPLAKIEAALPAVIAADAVEARVREALKAGTVRGSTSQERVDNAVATGVITEAEAQSIERARVLADDVIRVDDFEPDAALARNAAIITELARAA